MSYQGIFNVKKQMQSIELSKVMEGIIDTSEYPNTSIKIQISNPNPDSLVQFLVIKGPDNLF